MNSPDWKALRQVGDPLADAAIAEYFAAPPTAAWRQAWDAVIYNGDPDPEGAPPAFQQFLAETATWPADTDKARFARGQKVFGTFASEAFLVLSCYSLPYCYAAADGVKVLFASEKIRNNPGRRLTETGDFVMAVMHLQAMEPSQRGIRAIQKVRLLHASIRYHLLKHGWDQVAHGLPINQTDQSGTNMSFGWLVLKGLQKLGFRLRTAQKEDYLYAWSVIGRWMGVSPDLVSASPKVNHDWDQEIAELTFAPCEEGKVLTQALLHFMCSNAPNRLVGSQVKNLMGHLLGDKVATILGLQHRALPLGMLTKMMTPLLTLNGLMRNPKQGYHQGRLRLSGQKQQFMPSVCISEHFRPREA